MLPKLGIMVSFWVYKIKHLWANYEQYNAVLWYSKVSIKYNSMHCNIGKY